MVEIFFSNYFEWVVLYHQVVVYEFHMKISYKDICIHLGAG